MTEPSGILPTAKAATAGMTHRLRPTSPKGSGQADGTATTRAR
jgi:hypothetical protein